MFLKVTITLICFPNWNKSRFWYVSHFVVFSFACCNTRCEEAASVSRVPACALHTCVLLLTAIVILNLFRWEKERISIMLSIYLSSIHYHYLLLSFAMMTTLHNFHLFWTIDRISWGVENIRIFSISMKMNRWSLLLWSRILVLTFLFQQQLQKMCNLVLLCSIIHVLQHPGAMEVDKSCYCYVAIFRSNQTATTKCKNLFPLYQSCKIT